MLPQSKRCSQATAQVALVDSTNPIATGTVKRRPPAADATIFPGGGLAAVGCLAALALQPDRQADAQCHRCGNDHRVHGHRPRVL
ncbi:hypothetical protein ASL20_30850 [Cupriavidus necator]|uniref:hypothetical protein n=1 Tax=Cupriavidus necator TaxID=106590 RepID=UPI0007357E4C|nr:hypothetical protein [Cupriavidus necator]KUE85004.1 hypothetical protein ASL20_30850 [Cupriavidus necator]